MILSENRRKLPHNHGLICRPLDNRGQVKVILLKGIRPLRSTPWIALRWRSAGMIKLQAETRPHQCAGNYSNTQKYTKLPSRNVSRTHYIHIYIYMYINMQFSSALQTQKAANWTRTTWPSPSELCVKDLRRKKRARAQSSHTWGSATGFLSCERMWIMWWPLRSQQVGPPIWDGSIWTQIRDISSAWLVFKPSTRKHRSRCGWSTCYKHRRCCCFLFLSSHVCICCEGLRCVCTTCQRNYSQHSWVSEICLNQSRNIHVHSLPLHARRHLVVHI